MALWPGLWARRDRWIVFACALFVILLVWAKFRTKRPVAFPGPLPAAVPFFTTTMPTTPAALLSVRDQLHSLLSAPQDSIWFYFNPSVRVTEFSNRSLLAEGVVRRGTASHCHDTPLDPYLKASEIFRIEIEILAPLSAEPRAVVRSLARVPLDDTALRSCRLEHDEHTFYGFEDARLFDFAGSPHSIFTFLIPVGSDHRCVARMGVASLDARASYSMGGDSGRHNASASPLQVAPWTAVFLDPPDTEHPFQFQKNWSPFEMDGMLYAEFGVHPHRILRLDLAGHAARESHSTVCACFNGFNQKMHLSFPPVRIAAKFLGRSLSARLASANDVFLGAVHFPHRGYSTMFYLFDSQYPNRMLVLSHEFRFPETSDDSFVYVSSVSFLPPLTPPPEDANPTGTLLLQVGINDCYFGFAFVSFADIWAPGTFYCAEGCSLPTL